MKVKSYALKGYLCAALFGSAFLQTTSLEAQTMPERVLGQTDLVTTGFTSPTASTMFFPVGIATDGSGNLYVSDYWNRILIFKNINGKVTGAAADFVLGQPDFVTTSATTGPSGLSLPISLMLDNTGNLYVSDYSNNRILIFKNVRDRVNNNTLVNGAPADFVLGQSDLNNNFNGSPPQADNFMNVAGTAMDALGNLYVVDYYPSRIVMFPNVQASVNNNTFVNGMAATKVFGRPDFTTGGFSPDPVSINTLAFPQELLIDAAGNLYVTDKGNHRVLRYDNIAAKPSSATPDAVFGAADFNSGNGGFGPNDLYNPWGLTFNTTGDLLVAEGAGNRIVRYGSPATVTTNPTAATTFDMQAQAASIATVAGSGAWTAMRQDSRVALFGGSTALPQGLLSFTAMRHQDAVLLNWELAPAQARFRTVALQRSTDGRRFESIAHFEQGDKVRFDYRDAQAVNDRVYYRLELRAENGNLSYSEVRQLTVSGAAGMPQVWPNPAVDELRFYTGSDNAQQVWLTDLAGNTVSTVQTVTASGSLKMTHLPAGIYFLHIGQQACLKVVK